METIVWERGLGYVRLKGSRGILNLGTFAWTPALEKLRFRNVAGELSLGKRMPLRTNSRTNRIPKNAHTNDLFSRH